MEKEYFIVLDTVEPIKYSIKRESDRLIATAYFKNHSPENYLFYLDSRRTYQHEGSHIPIHEESLEKIQSNKQVSEMKSILEKFLSDPKKLEIKRGKQKHPTIVNEVKKILKKLD